MRPAGRLPVGEHSLDRGGIDAGEVIEECADAVAGGNMIKQGLERHTGSAENRRAPKDGGIAFDVCRKLR